MFGSTSVSHAQKQRKVLTNMRESAWLPRSFKRKKKTIHHYPNPKIPPAAQDSNTPKPPVPHLSADKTDIRKSSSQHILSQPMAVEDCRRWVCPGPRFGWTAYLPLSPDLQMGSISPSPPFIENHVCYGTANRLVSLSTEELRAVSK